MNNLLQDAEADLFAQADAARDARDWPRAASLYGAALERDAARPEFWVQYGHALKESGRLGEAEAAYRESLRYEPGAADTHLQLGHLHKLTGRRRLAERGFLDALRLEPDLADARRELAAFGWTSTGIRAALDTPGHAELAVDAVDVHIAFELSDLLDFLQSNRFPTGIQRVQVEVALALASTKLAEFVSFVYYDHHAASFKEIDRSAVLDMMDAIERGERTEIDRLQIVSQIKTSVMAMPAFDFVPGSYLVNMGTSWGYTNQFLSIREAKARFGIRWVPYVHDCIPLIFPEFCNPALVRDFINWISGLPDHADLILGNSRNTLNDYERFTRLVTDQRLPAETLILNGDSRRASVAPDDASLGTALKLHGIEAAPFVLFVSTLEPRKNHMLALNAWSRMLKTRPPGSVPKLVCVGNTGWMNDDIHNRITRDAVLRESVVLLSNISDQLLHGLYRRCLFTVFPSLYEGWGLPITEALAYGKVPVVSRVSAHPEAGGDHAVYFDPYSESDFQEQVERLIDQPAERAALERRIGDAKPLRAWAEVAAELLATLGQHRRDAGAASPPQVPAILTGRYYAIARNTSRDLRRLTHLGEGFRAGPGWHSPEDWGTWISGRVADLALRIPGSPTTGYMVYLHLIGVPDLDTMVGISILGTDWDKAVLVPRDRDHVEAIPVVVPAAGDTIVGIRLVLEAVANLGQSSAGRDVRDVALGVKGIYACAVDDVVGRVALLEAMALRDLSGLQLRQPHRAVIGG